MSQWETTIMSLKLEDNFKLHLQVFLKEVERRYWNYLADIYGQATAYKKQIEFKIDNGKRYLKISVMHSEANRVSTENLHSFIEKTNGDIFMPASYKAPAKEARGNIFFNYGYDAFNNNGNADINYQVRYLK